MRINVRIRVAKIWTGICQMLFDAQQTWIQDLLVQD